MIRFVLLFVLATGWAATALAADPLAEVRKSFTINGKPIPPEIFGDFGDAMISDNRPIIVTVDALAAVGSNRYSDPITRKGDWVEQKKPGSTGVHGDEAMAYRFVGATSNGLLVVEATWTGGGTGVFHTLHIVDVAWKPAFDEDGTKYKRLDLALVRSYILGDRWEGGIKISGNAIRITTTGSRSERSTLPVTLQAQRP